MSLDRNRTLVMLEINIALLTECRSFVLSRIYKHRTPAGVGPLELWTTSQINLRLCVAASLRGGALDKLLQVSSFITLPLKTL